MDFFAHQDVARRRTARLVALFVVGVLAVMAAVYFAVAVFVLAVGQAQSAQQVHGQAAQSAPPIDLFDWRLLATIAPGTLIIVAGASLYRVASLAGGGQVVALGLGGRLLDADADDLDERKLLNVVEEMAIASGTPVPPVYVLDDEKGINAFAAGFSPSDAVIGVTAGCMRTLNRDQLQGVIAHEFSHILNGDMRLNIRLMGAVFGLTAVGLIGYGLIRVAGHAMRGAGRSRGRDKGGGLALVAALFLLGLALVVIGYIGTLFGHIMRAAVSRQREFLADAAAVQFTRNPEGIAGALKSIGGYWQHASVHHVRAQEAGHMFFGQALEAGLSGLLATHPPLTERIRRLDPSFDGQFPQVALGEGPRPIEERFPTRRREPRVAGVSAIDMGAVPVATAPIAAPPAMLAIGNPTPEHVDYARQVIDAIPAALVQAARDPFDARAVVFALLLDADADVRQRQLAALKQNCDEPTVARMLALRAPMSQLDAAAHLPLIDMVVPALGRMSAEQYRVFREQVRSLVDADQRMDVFEWMLEKILLRHLGARFDDARPTSVRYYALQPLAGSCAVVLAVLAYVGQRDAEAARAAFEAGWRVLELPIREIPPAGACTLTRLDESLDQLAAVSLREKRRLLSACAITIDTDRQVSRREAELFRAVADGLGCPMPPLLPGQPLA